MKIAGRHAGKLCTIVEIVDKNFCIIDGMVKRKRCNIDHLEPTSKKIDIKEKATHEQVVDAFKKLGFEIKTTKTKKAAQRPKHLKKKKVYELTKEEKKAAKAEEKKLEAAAANLKKASGDKPSKPGITEVEPKSAAPKAEVKKEEIKPASVKPKVEAKPALKKEEPKKVPPKK